MNVGGTSQIAISIFMVLCGIINYIFYEINWTVRQNTASKVIIFLADLTFMLNSIVIFLFATHFGYRGIITYYTLFCFVIGNGLARVCLARIYRKIIRLIMRMMNRLKQAQKTRTAARLAKKEIAKANESLSSEPKKEY